MAGNLEGTLSTGGASKCGAGAANCFAFQAPPANARALGAAGLDVVNLANNHAFDYGEAGRTQTLGALTAAKVAFTGLPGDVRVLARRGVRVAFVGFSTYRWTPSMDDPQAVRALIDQAEVLADVVVVFFHAGAEGSDRTGVPVGREWAFGEDRGDSRAFAHLAIDAGADLVLGSGPHVVRGMETYRGRLIALLAGQLRRRAQLRLGRDAVGVGRADGARRPSRAPAQRVVARDRARRRRARRIRTRARRGRSSPSCPRGTSGRPRRGCSRAAASCRRARRARAAVLPVRPASRSASGQRRHEAAIALREPRGSPLWCGFPP